MRRFSDRVPGFTAIGTDWAGGNDPRRHAHRGRTVGHVIEDDGVCADFRMISDRHAPEDSGTRPDVDVPSQFRASGNASACPQRDLLKDQTIGPDDGLGVDHDSIGMWQEQTSADWRVQVNLCSGDDAPDAIPEDVPTGVYGP
jgi:hypothetical protein